MMLERYFDWNEDKNQRLQKERGVSFEEVVVAIEEHDGLLDILRNKEPRGHQQLYIVKMNNYVYVVPVIVNKEKVFLKTAYPSRKMFKQYEKEINI